MLAALVDVCRAGRRFTSNTRLVLIVAVFCNVYVLRFYNYTPKFYIFDARQCMHRKTEFLTNTSAENFFNIMWRVMPNVIHICSYGKFAHRIETIYNGTERMLFLREISQIDEHPCHVVFVSENETLALPLAFKQNYGSCSVHSSALLHLASPPLSANETVTTYKLRVDPRGGLKGELFEGVDPDAHNIVSMVTLISSFVKRAMLMSVVINTRDANLFLPLFFANGAFEMATMSTCQLSIAYPKPKTIVEMEQFQTAWERLLHDRRYLPVQVVRNQDVMNMFLVSIATEYCWTKYISNIEQTKVVF